MALRLRRRASSSWGDVLQHAGELFPVSPPPTSSRRRPIVVEWAFIGMVWTAGAMWIASTPVRLAGSERAGLLLVGYGLSLLLLSLIPLCWALVKRRGRVAPLVRWTALGVFLLGLVPALLGTFVG